MTHNLSRRKLSAVFVAAALLVMAVALSARAKSSADATSAAAGVHAVPTNNPPWYPSLQAFEHYNSGRSHVFSQATFGGSMTGKNIVTIKASPEDEYPSGYNMSYLNSKNAFIQGGSYGDVKGSIGPFVAKLNPITMKKVWYTQLRNARKAHEWDYPGAMAIEHNGYIYVVSGYHIWKLNPANGAIVATLKLPTIVHNRSNYAFPLPPNPEYYKQPSDERINTSYNGINALPDGTIIVKSLYRTPGCPLNGPSAVISCNLSQNVAASNLISVDPNTMQIIDKITLPAIAAARPSITEYNGVDYVYLNEKVASPVRYIVKHGHFKLDQSWQPDISKAGIPLANQTTGGSLIVMNNWIVGATNSVPSNSPLIMFAINQGNANDIISTEPYANDQIAPELKAAFKSAAVVNGQPAQAYSWADMSLEADPQNTMFYGVETMTREVAAFKIVNNQIQTVWKQHETTTEWATLIGPSNQRVWVSTDIPIPEIPGNNRKDVVVWRDAATGKELVRSGQVPVMTQGTAIQPGYGGSVYFPSSLGTLYRLTPHAAGR